MDVQRLGAEFNFELNAYPYAMVGKGDLSQRHIKIAMSNGQTTLATIEGEIQQDNISATLVASNNQLRFGFIPSEKRLRYVVEVMNHYSSNGKIRSKLTNKLGHFRVKNDPRKTNGDIRNNKQFQVTSPQLNSTLSNLLAHKDPFCAMLTNVKSNLTI